MGYALFVWPNKTMSFDFFFLSPALQPCHIDRKLVIVQINAIAKWMLSVCSLWCARQATGGAIQKQRTQKTKPKLQKLTFKKEQKQRPRHSGGLSGFILIIFYWSFVYIVSNVFQMQCDVYFKANAANMFGYCLLLLVKAFFVRFCNAKIAKHILCHFSFYSTSNRKSIFWM